MTLPIVTVPDAKLHQPSQTLDKARATSTDFDALLKACYETMVAANGIGIAAPQVGLNERFFIALHGTTPVVMINPEIIWKSEQTETSEEGCLSVPGVNVDVGRVVSVRMRYTDPLGLQHEMKARGLYARILQHELDHLNGTLITDHGTAKHTHPSKRAPS